MTTLQFQCPQCTGLFQTDSSFAGQSVACPMCGAGVALPPLEMLEPPPSHFPAPSGAMPLACPVCSGGFMIPPELAGQQVACPHCHSPVMVPDNEPMGPEPMSAPPLSAPAPPPPDYSSQAGPKIEFTGPAQPSRYPPGFEPPTAPSRPAPPTSNPAPRAEPASLYPPGMGPPGKAAPTGPAAPADNRFPPGFAPQKPTSAPAAEKPKPAPAPVDYRLPPGAAPQQRPAEPAPRPSEKAPRPAEPAPRTATTSKSPSPVAEPAPRAKLDDLLPPGAAEIDELLPPGSGEPAPSSSPSSPLRPIAVSKPAKDDALLPPGMDEAGVGGPMQQVALPEEEMARQLKALNRPLPPTNVPKDAVVIETEEGEYVALREPVKTVGTGSEERELRVLSPQEKQRRRLIRNIVVYAVGLTILVVTFMMLTRL